MGEKISASEFARRSGVSRQAISQAIKAGRLKAAGQDDRGRPLYEWPSKSFAVDVNQVDRVDNQGGRPHGGGGPPSDRNGTPPPARQAALSGGEDDPRERLLLAKAANTESQASLNALRLQEKSGEMISKEEAYQQGMELGAVLLSQLQAWPARLSPMLASMKEANEHDFHQMLVAEINELIITIRVKLGVDPALEPRPASR